MSKGLDSGRIETGLACLILCAVLGLFVKFYQPQPEGPPAAPAGISAPSVGDSASPIHE